jgi:hypothetical protein
MADRSPFRGIIVLRLTKRNSRWESARAGRFYAPGPTIRSMDLNPYESPREPEGFYEPKSRAGWLDALPGLAVIVVFLLSPFIAMGLPEFGIFHWPVTLICVSLTAVSVWAIARKAIGD